MTEKITFDQLMDYLEAYRMVRGQISNVIDTDNFALSIQPELPFPLGVTVLDNVAIMAKGLCSRQNIEYDHHEVLTPAVSGPEAPAVRFRFTTERFASLLLLDSAAMANLEALVKSHPTYLHMV